MLALPHPGAYVALYHRTRAHLEAGGLVRLEWSQPPVDLDGFRREWRAALDRRINARVGVTPQGRKYAERWQIDIARDCATLRYMRHNIDTRRFNTAEMRRRYTQN